ncbi:Polypyrimidine tract-binding protein [Trichinella spiralis]|uniref:Polypyrimidine tract-binding protein n=1 Tax=Trichinella spiralis TaxID=6334 RepID=A0ABR3K254_TRISP
MADWLAECVAITVTAACRSQFVTLSVNDSLRLDGGADGANERARDSTAPAVGNEPKGRSNAPDDVESARTPTE